ncbi:hypothetical protein EEB13_03135 [Rhodococcus sp. WS3]|nr:hypothetical protein EEB13_03135 [Rhodococcus sp. WS3]
MTTSPRDDATSTSLNLLNGNVVKMVSNGKRPSFQVDQPWNERLRIDTALERAPEMPSPPQQPSSRLLQFNGAPIGSTRFV